MFSTKKFSIVEPGLVCYTYIRASVFNVKVGLFILISYFSKIKIGVFLYIDILFLPYWPMANL